MVHGDYCKQVVGYPSSKTKVCNPIMDTSNSAYDFWPLEEIVACLIQLVIVNHEDCQGKIYKRSE